jgi:hypothetical protein
VKFNPFLQPPNILYSQSRRFRNHIIGHEKYHHRSGSSDGIPLAMQGPQNLQKGARQIRTDFGGGETSKETKSKGLCHEPALAK